MGKTKILQNFFDLGQIREKAPFSGEKDGFLGIARIRVCNLPPRGELHTLRLLRPCAAGFADLLELSCHLLDNVGVL